MLFLNYILVWLWTLCLVINTKSFITSNNDGSFMYFWSLAWIGISFCFLVKNIVEIAKG
jgi:hypothetical protein